MKLNLFFTCESVFTLIIRPAKEPRRVEGKIFSIPTLSIVRMFNFKTHLALSVQMATVKVYFIASSVGPKQ